MNIKKILKFYLVLTLGLTAFAALNYNDEFRHYLSTYATSVLNYKYNDPKPYSTLYSATTLPKAAYKSYTFYNKNPGNVVFNITHDSIKSMTNAGVKGAEIMIFNFKTGNDSIELENLALKINGIDGKDIEAAYLTIGEETVANAFVSSSYLQFNNINYEIQAKSVSAIKLKLDLSENLKINNRIRLDIENPQDITVRINGNLYGLNGYYPMKGAYLSISKLRQAKPSTKQ